MPPEQEGLEQRPRWAFWWFVGLFILTVWVAVCMGLTRPLWNDEIGTETVAHLRSFGAICDALRTATDSQPPLFFWLTGLTNRLFSSAELGLRAPAIAGFSCVIACMFVFMRRAQGSAAALVSVTFLLCSEGLYYASEARPYGALLGCVGLAMIFWQARKRLQGGLLSVIATAAALAAVCSLHYYGLFVVAAFGLAELVIAFRSRKPDWAMFAAFPLAVIPILLAKPLVDASRSQFGHSFWARPSLKAIAAGYQFAFSLPVLNDRPLFHLGAREVGVGDFLGPLFLGALAVCIFVWTRRGDSSRLPQEKAEPEVWLACGFLSLPLLAGIAGMLVLGVYTPRYTVSSLLGASILFGWICDRAGTRVAWVAAGLLTCFFVWHQLPGSINRISGALAGNTPAIQMQRNFGTLYRYAAADVPVVISDGHLFIEAWRYAPTELRQRLIYLQDRKLAVQYSGNDSLDATNEGLKQYLDLPLRDALPFLSATRDFVTATREGTNPWLLTYLRVTGGKITRVENGDPQILLYRISQP